jgi:mycothiol synthase
MSATLPQGFTLRRPSLPDDIVALANLARVIDMVTLGEPDTTVDDVRSDLETTNLEQDAWVIVAPDGQYAAFASLDSNKLGKFYGRITVHPEYQRRGLGTYLGSLVRARAIERMGEVAADARVTLNGSIFSDFAASCRFVERAGMSRIRSFWRMEIHMTEPPPSPIWPDGLKPRIFVRDRDDRAVYTADEEAFQDHWGHSQTSYEDWLAWSVRRADFDPSLWFLAMDGEEIAGAALCWAVPSLGDNGLGWVGQLWVRRPWRRRGLGLALLHHAFSDLYPRGYKRVGLGVDSESLTGATRLYERAGMHVAHQWDNYEMELRSGVEYTVSRLEQDQ